MAAAPARSTPRGPTALPVLGRLERGHLEPDHIAVDGDVGEQRAQAGVAQPARHRELRRQDVRVEHVEVQVDVDLAAARDAPTTSDGRTFLTPVVSTSTRSPASRSRTPHMSTRAGSSEGSKPASQRPQDGGQAHAAEEAARRRLGRVGVAVGVEPQHADVGRVADDGLERRHADRAVRGRQDRERAGGRACPRPGRRLRAGSRASRAGRRPSWRSACSPSVPTRRAFWVQRRARAPPRRARRPACGRTSGSAAP